jgi:hypothetical protein
MRVSPGWGAVVVDAEVGMIPGGTSPGKALACDGARPSMASATAKTRTTKFL